MTDYDPQTGVTVPVSPALNDLATRTLDAAFEVHRILRAGLLESNYEDALCVELTLRGIRFERQKPISLTYKGHPIGQTRVDLIVDGQLLVELKAVEKLMPIHKAQAISYLGVTGLKLAIIINFNTVLLKGGIQRVVLS